MEDNPKELPGAPPPTEVKKPKPSNENRPAFSFLELQFIGTDYVDNERWVIFGTETSIIRVKEFEYYQYLNHCFTESEVCIIEDRDCHCDSCTPDFIEEDNQDSKLINVDNENETSIKSYIVTNLVKNTQFSIHDKHKEND